MIKLESCTCAMPDTGRQGLSVTEFSVNEMYRNTAQRETHRRHIKEDVGNSCNTIVSNLRVYARGILKPSRYIGGSFSQININKTSNRRVESLNDVKSFTAKTSENKINTDKLWPPIDNFKKLNLVSASKTSLLSVQLSKEI